MSERSDELLRGFQAQEKRFVERRFPLRLAPESPALRELYAQLNFTSVAALDELIAAGRGGASLAETLRDYQAEDPVATLVDRDSRRQLADAIAQLAERDRVVVTLYYFENLTLAEIGRVLGVTESRVCQLHTRAVLRLRAKLVEHPDG